MHECWHGHYSFAGLQFLMRSLDSINFYLFIYIFFQLQHISSIKSQGCCHKKKENGGILKSVPSLSLSEDRRRLRCVFIRKIYFHLAEFNAAIFASDQRYTDTVCR